MRKVAPRLPRILSDAEIESMHETALRVIEEVGIRVDNKRALNLLSRRDGVTIREHRVCIEPRLVEGCVKEHRRYLESMPDRMVNSDRVEIIKHVSGVNRFILDPNTDEIRPVTVKDLVELTKLVDALHSWGVRGAAPGVPQDVPPQLQAITAFWIGSKYSRCGGGTGATSRPLQAEEYLYEMYKIMEKPFSLPVYAVSPLSLKGEAFEIALHFVGREGVSFSVSSMPVMGMSAPISFPAAFVLAMAEVIGVFTIMNLIAESHRVTFSINAHPFDMTYGNIVFGSPEHNLCDLIQIEVNRYYGHKTISTRSIRSMAARPGVQAQAEKAASAIVGALAGSRSFSSAGLLALDEVFSAEQLIIDCEIVDYTTRFVEGFSFDIKDLDFDIIKEGVAKGNFITHRTTLKNLRKVYWTPKLFEHKMFRQREGEMTTKENVQKIIKEKIAEYDFKLEEGKERRLDEIYKKACKFLI